MAQKNSEVPQICKFGLTRDSERYREFLTMWKDADLDHPEVATAKAFLAKQVMSEK